MLYMSEKATEELFEAPTEVKTIEEEPEPKEVEEQKKEKQLNKKGKERAKNKDGTYRKRKEQTPEQREKMLEALARGREKARKVRLMKGAITKAKKVDKSKELEREYLELLDKKKKVVNEEGNSNEELKELKKELAELKKMFKELGSKPPPQPKEEKVEASVTEVVKPVVESVPVQPVKEPTPVVVEEPPQTLPIPPTIRKKTLRAKSIWSKFV